MIKGKLYRLKHKQFIEDFQDDIFFETIDLVAINSTGKEIGYYELKNNNSIFLCLGRKTYTNQQNVVFDKNHGFAFLCENTIIYFENRITKKYLYEI